MKQIFTLFFNRKMHLLMPLCLLLVTSSVIAQVTATEEFETESGTTFSEGSPLINFNHTFSLRTANGFGYNGSNKYLELATPTGIANSSATISINNALNPSVSFKINSFAAYVSAGNAGASPYNGPITVSGTAVGNSSAVSAVINIASTGTLPSGQTRDANGVVDGINFSGTALDGLYFTSLTFSIIDNDLNNGAVGTRYLELDHINFTTAAVSTNQFSIADARITEGSSGTKSLNFNISRTSTTTASSVQVQSSNGTATAGSDYVAFPLTTVSFPVGGATSQTVSVIINGDLTAEADETFSMTLSNPTGGTIFGATATGTILDDDNITETFEDETVSTGSNSTIRSFSEKGFNFLSSGDLYVSRGSNLGAGNCGCNSNALDTRTNGIGSSGNVGSFYTNSAGTSFDLKSIDVFTSNNDGTSGTTANVSVTFIGSKADGSGTVNYTATITPISGDNYQTVNFAGTPFANIQLLSVSVTLGSGINYVSLDNIRYGTVSFSGVQLSINDVSVLEGTGGGTGTATFTVTRSSNSSAFSVNYATSDVSAVAGSDYVATSGTLTFISGGPLTQTISVTILRDALIEGNETFNMTLSGATNSVLYQKPIGVVTILDDDKIVETFEDETNSATTFSENSVGFSATGKFRVNYNNMGADGSGSSKGYLTTSTAAGTSANTGGSMGKIVITSPNTGFKLLQLDAWTGNGTSPSYISGPVTFTGTLYGGGTVSTIKTITPTNNTGTGWQQNITFTGTPLDNVVLTDLEFIAGGSVTAVEIDNINYVAVTTVPYIEVTDAANIAIPDGSAASTTNNTDFGASCVASSVSKTFTIKNTGGVNLVLSGSPLAVVGGADAGQFSVTTQPAATIAAGSSTTFTVRYTPNAAATHNATITLISNDAANATYTINIKGTGIALPAFSAQPTASPASGICSGGTVTLSASYSGVGTPGASTVQWFKGSSTTPFSLGPTGTGSTAIIQSVSGGSASITITNLSPVDVDNYYLKITSSTGCGTATSNTITFPVAPPTIPNTNTSGSKSVTLYDYRITNAACNMIASVLPSGASQVGGVVNASVTIDPAVQTAPNGSPYAQRHYDIVPATNASTATGTITLYFTQAEFTAYNANPAHGLNLPVDATDAANYRANVRIYQYHGTGSTPGNYTGLGEEINPADNNIVWNSTYARWEVTFNVVGFSGFYLASAGSMILPLNNVSFTGLTNGTNAWLQWKGSNEINVSHYEIERSKNGVQFTTIGQVPAGNYRFTDQPIEKTVYYYRLKVMDKDGKYSYSSVVAISLKKASTIVQVLPNPFTDKLLLNISATNISDAEMRLVDMSGKAIVQKNIRLQIGTNAVTIDQLSHLAKGAYLLQVLSEKNNETIKVLKAE